MNDIKWVLIFVSMAAASNENMTEIPLTGMVTTELGLLNLAENQLTGTTPTELGLLTALNVLSLWGNNLSGTVPEELGMLSGLVDFDNKFTGTMPSTICELRASELTILLVSCGTELRSTCPTSCCSACA